MPVGTGDMTPSRHSPLRVLLPSPDPDGADAAVELVGIVRRELAEEWGRGELERMRRKLRGLIQTRLQEGVPYSQLVRKDHWE